MFRPYESGYYRRIVRDVGAKNMEVTGPPGPQLVMNASAKQALRHDAAACPRIWVGF